MKNSFSFSNRPFWTFLSKKILLPFYENLSKVLGYQGSNNILIITLISSHPKHFSHQYFFLRSTNCKNFFMGNVSWLFFGYKVESVGRPKKSSNFQFGNLNFIFRCQKAFPKIWNCFLILPNWTCYNAIG